MATCPSCGEENPERAKFCLDCGTSLLAPTRVETEERKVVTAIFCDLVGFTSRSEQADPEDVRAAMREYYRVLREEIERHGGTVEKFIGDAVMGVFGAPVAHEDDPERAVRAGLRILEAVEGLNLDQPGLDLAVRVGINTGEAVVVLGARVVEGEGMVTGDVITTAARLQSAAPEGAVVVGESTWAATRDVFDYEQLEPVELKGKAEPVALWRATAARARFGTDLTRRHATVMAEALRMRHADSRMVFLDTTSLAMLERERSVEALSRWAESIIVAGDAGEASVRALIETARRLGLPAKAVADAWALDPKVLAGVSRIGVTSGEFSPDAVAAAIVARLETEGSGTPAA